MRRQTLLLRFQAQAGPPEEDPPGFEVTSEPGTVTLLDGADEGVPTEARCVTHVTMTGEGTFEQTGEITFDGGSLTLSNAVPGVLRQTPQEATAMGAVTWLVEGTGRFSGATGIVSSNFEFQTATGRATEQQVARLYLP
jgi:hypothetical protein